MNDEMLELEDVMQQRHAEISSLKDLEGQRGTPIPALFNVFFKYIQNPSTVSVETFKRMVDTDDTIGSGLDFLITCLMARLGRYEHPSKEVTEWVNLALTKVDGGFEESLKEILAASWAGFSVQEKVFSNDDMGFIIKKMVPLPQTSILFETERTGELTRDGILQFQRGNRGLGMTSSLYGFAGGQASFPLRPDPLAKFGDYPFPVRIANAVAYFSIHIPVEKCIHLAWNTKGNPYGRSLLRRVYKWWVTKDAFLQMLSIALDRKGTPLTVCFANPSVTLADPEKTNEGKTARGNARGGIRADVAAKRAFENIHNDSFIVLPGAKGQIFDLDFVPQASNSQEFMGAIDLCNKSIMRGMLIPSLIFTNGDGTGSYSLGQEHVRTFNKILDGMLIGLENTLLYQAVNDLLKYNFPESAWKKDGIGSFGKRDVSIDEIQKEVEVLDRAVTMGAIDLNDLNDLNSIREKIGFEPRSSIIEKPDLFDDRDEDQIDDQDDGDIS